MESLTELEDDHFSYASWPVSSQDLPISAHQCWTCRRVQPRHLHVGCLSSCSRGGEDSKSPWAHWQVSQSSLTVELHAQWETLPQKIKWQATEEVTWHQLLVSTHMHTQSLTHTHTRTHIHKGENGQFFCVTILSFGSDATGLPFWCLPCLWDMW